MNPTPRHYPLRHTVIALSKVFGSVLTLVTNTALAILLGAGVLLAGAITLAELLRHRSRQAHPHLTPPA